MLLNDEEVAVHCHNQWCYRDRPFTAVLIAGRVLVRCQDEVGSASPLYGPFDRVKLVDGTIRYGHEYRDLLARFNEKTGRWGLYARSGEWPRVVFFCA